MKKQKNEKNKNYLRIIVICIIIAIIVGVVIAILVGNQKNTNEQDEQIGQAEYEFPNNQIDMENTLNAEIVDSEKRNTSAKLSQERTYNDMQIKNIRLTATKNVSQFTATVKSELDKPVEGENIYVVFIKQDGSEIAKIETYFPDLEPKGEATLYLSSEADIANAYDFYITK